MANLSVYVVAHKKFTCPQIDYLKPIQVGKNEDLGFLYRDNTGEHIAQKNANYCELTAMYWIWKNDCDSDIIGICHYRRYFTKNSWSSSSIHFWKGTELQHILNNYDVIAPKRLSFPKSVGKNYFAHAGREKDLRLVGDVIQKKCPEYAPAYDSVLEGHAGYYYNMMIMSRNQYGQYCKWLFSILEQVEKQIDLSGYTAEEARVYGYLSELLFNVWLLYNGSKVKELPVVNTDMNMTDRIKFNIKYGVFRLVFGGISKGD